MPKNVDVALELGYGRGQKNFKICDRKSLDCLDKMIGGNIDIKDNFGEDSERSVENAEKSFIILENAYAVIQNVAADVNVKGTPGEVSAGNDEHVIGCWSQSIPCYKAAGNLAQFQRSPKILGQHIILM